LTPEQLEAAKKTLSEAAGKGVLIVSVVDDELLKAFSDQLSQLLTDAEPALLTE
jgi:nitrogen regulatory protein PII-like uncharacterized protein